MADEAFQRLTDKQRAYLRLVHDGRTTKEIARAIGDAPATIDTRILEAARILGVRGRHAAADALAAFERSTRISDEPPSLVLASAGAPPAAPGHGSPTGTQPRGAPLPFATTGRPWNELSGAQRLGWIGLIALGTAIVAGGIGSGSLTLLNALLDFVQGHRSVFYH